MARGGKKRRQDASSSVQHQGAPPPAPWRAWLWGWLRRAVLTLRSRFFWADARTAPERWARGVPASHRKKRRRKAKKERLRRAVLIADDLAAAKNSSSPALLPYDDATPCQVTGAAPVQVSRTSSSPALLHPSPRCQLVLDEVGGDLPTGAAPAHVYRSYSCPALLESVLPSVTGDSGGYVGLTLEATSETVAASSPASKDVRGEAGWQLVLKKKKRRTERKTPLAEEVAPKLPRRPRVAPVDDRQVLRPSQLLVPVSMPLAVKYSELREEEDFCIDRLFDTDEENDSEREAHTSYYTKDSKLKSKKTYCLQCHLKGVNKILNWNDDEVKDHCRAVHKTSGFACNKQGCLARSANRHDIGVHEFVCHRM